MTKKALYSFIFLCFTVMLCSQNADPYTADTLPPRQIPGMKLVWGDEFNVDGKPNPANWIYENGFVRNEELQWYQPDNANVEDGLLVIDGKRETVLNPNYDPTSTNWRRNRQYAYYTAAGIKTRGLVAYQFGRFEIRARIDTTKGSWPAIWTLGVTGEWPSSGEIDIMEFYRVAGVPNILANVAWGTSTRWVGKWDSSKKPLSYFLNKDPDWPHKFHVWRMDWNKDSIKLYLDDELLNYTLLSETINPLYPPLNPFLQKHSFLLNLAIGSNGGDPSKSKFPIKYEVDYIRVYQDLNIKQPDLSASYKGDSVFLAIQDGNGDDFRGFMLERKSGSSHFEVVKESNDRHLKHWSGHIDLEEGPVKFRVRSHIDGGYITPYSPEIGWDVTRSDGVIRWGTVGVSNNSWTPVFSSHPQDSVVMILGAPGNSNAYNRLSPRLRWNSEGKYYEVQAGLWEYQNVIALAQDEMVPYIQMARGTHNLGGGVKAIAASAPVIGQWTNIPFPEPFDTIPVVFANTTTAASSYNTALRIRAVTTTGFQAKLVNQASNSSTPGLEQLSYIALLPGTSSVNGRMMKVGRTSNIYVTTFPKLVLFGTSVDSPHFITQMQTANDEVAAALRTGVLTHQGIDIFKQRELSTDITTTSSESAGWLVIETSKPAVELPDSFMVEAEDGFLEGVHVATAVSGFSGTGYVTGFDNNGTDRVTVSVQLPASNYYRLVIRYRSHYGGKIQDILLNKDKFPVTFPQCAVFQDIDVGTFLMEEGAQNITLQSNWGYMDVDQFRLVPAKKNEFAITPDLVDETATDDTRKVYEFLRTHFGTNIISGQTNDYFNELVAIAGKTPLLRSWDLKSYTAGYPYVWVNSKHTFGAYDNGSVQGAINWFQQTNKQGLVSFHWHWHAPSGGEAGTNTFYTNETSFDVSKAVQPGTTEYDLIIRDIDAIAHQLKRLRDAGVPVIWRPLHEAGGGWFWWGAKGAAACLELYNILFDRLRYHHQLNNLIWVWSTPEAEWYPGNDKVDIIGEDSYPGAMNYSVPKNAFDQLYRITNGKKMIAMTENGPIPDPGESIRLEAPWSFFMSWSDLVDKQNSHEHIQKVYAHPQVITLENAAFFSGLTPGYDEQFDIKVKDKFIHITGEHWSKIQIADVYGRIWISSNNQDGVVDVHSLHKGIYIILIYKDKTLQHAGKIKIF